MKRNRNNSLSKEQLSEAESRHQQHLDAKEAYRKELEMQYANWSKEDLLKALIDKEVYEYFYR